MACPYRVSSQLPNPIYIYCFARAQVKVSTGITNSLVTYGLAFDEVQLWAGVNMQMVRDCGGLSGGV